MRQIAFLYPGQGAQKIGMGKSFYENSVLSKEVFQMANSVLGFSVTDLCFEENSLLDQTQYTQPALVTTCLAMTKEVISRGVVPKTTLGLSLGEYAAIAVAGGFSFETAIKAVQARGAYMNEACPAGMGTMCAVLGLEGGKVEKVIEPIREVYIANYNCPGQIVITGESHGVEEAVPRLMEAGAKKCIPLKVSGPFHSPLLCKAGSKLKDYLTNVEVKDLEIPYVTNVTAESVRDKEMIKSLLEKQVCSSVRFEQSIRNMIEEGIDTFVEIGPGKTLSSFVKKIDRSVFIANIETIDDLYKLEEIL